MGALLVENAAELLIESALRFSQKMTPFHEISYLMVLIASSKSSYVPRRIKAE